MVESREPAAERQKSEMVCAGRVTYLLLGRRKAKSQIRPNYPEGGDDVVTLGGACRVVSGNAHMAEEKR